MSNHFYFKNFFLEFPKSLTGTYTWAWIFFFVAFNFLCYQQMYSSIINLNTYSLKHFNLFVNYVHASKFVSSLGINLDFFFIQHSAISQFILTILVFVIMVWALMRSFKISCWLHENFQWVTRTIHTLHLLIKDIISASSHRHKQGLARAKVACRKQHQSVHWSEETEYIIPAHSENRWDKDTFYPSKTNTAT